MANEVRLIDAAPLIADGWVLERHGISNVIIGRKSLADVPTIDPESLRPKGRWERTGEADYKCSVCGFRFTSGDPIEMFPYCRCGCKMEG